MFAKNYDEWDMSERADTGLKSYIWDGVDESLGGERVGSSGGRSIELYSLLKAVRLYWGDNVTN